MQTFEQFLEEYFVGLNEIDGMPITKDNFEAMYERWKYGVSVDYIIELVNIYVKEKEIC